MEIRNEAHLQDLITQELRQLGEEPEREVNCNGGRVDIWTDTHLIEVKKFLTRDDIYQALGQLQLYKTAYPNHKLVIAGITPDTNEGANSAFNIANLVEKNCKCEVWFVDTEDPPPSIKRPIFKNPFKRSAVLSSGISQLTKFKAANLQPKLETKYKYPKLRQKQTQTYKTHKRTNDNPNLIFFSGLFLIVVGIVLFG